MLQNMRLILNQAKQDKKAIPQFNINNLEWIRFILEACEEKKSPVILGVSMSAAKYMGGFKNVYSMVINLIDSLNITIPVSLHLDHANSFEDVKQAIDAGFTSVMIDYSKHILDENIDITKKVISYAKEKDVLVEGEIGTIEVNGYANLKDCIKYVNETGVDMLAPAIGNLHGIYQTKPNLQFDLLKDIRNNVNIPLVLHGGSLISDDDIKKLIDFGICKLNINTELQLAWFKGLKDEILNSDEYDPRKVISYGEKNMKEVIYHKIELCNCCEQ